MARKFTAGKQTSAAFFVLLFIFLGWLLVASIRVYSSTKAAKTLIEQIRPYEQVGDNSKTVLFVGDSFGYGTGASSSDATLAGLMGSHWPNATIVNKSKNGTKSSDLASRINDDIDAPYSVIVVIVGANDVIHAEVDIASSRYSFQTIYQTASANADAVIAITVGSFTDISFFMWPLNHYFGRRSQSINQIAEQEASNYANIVYIDAFDQALHPPYPRIFESQDRLHLNDAGTRYWFQKILERTNDLRFDSP